MGEPKAMVSSASSVHAERVLIRSDLSRIFTNVIRAPEESRAGTKSESYLDDAVSSDFLVVLLSQESRPAVVEEIRAALDSGAHVAGFSLHYPPYRERGGPWQLTPEERMLHEHKLFVKPVESIVELRSEVSRALAHFLSTTVNRFRPSNSEQNYALAKQWLAPPDIARVALVQRTSMLLLGPRRGHHDETACMKSLNLLLNRIRSRKNRPEFVHLFDMNETLIEANINSGDYGLPGALNHVRSYIERPTPRYVHISKLDDQVALASVLLVNDKVALGTPLGSGGSFLSVVEDRQTADSVIEMLKQNQPANFTIEEIDDIEKALARKS